MFSIRIKYNMDTYHAAHWSDISYSSSEEDEDKRYKSKKDCKTTRNSAKRITYI